MNAQFDWQLPLHADVPPAGGQQSPLARAVLEESTKAAQLTRKRRFRIDLIEHLSRAIWGLETFSVKLFLQRS